MLLENQHILVGGKDLREQLKLTLKQKLTWAMIKRNIKFLLLTIVTGSTQIDQGNKRYLNILQLNLNLNIKWLNQEMQVKGYSYGKADLVAYQEEPSSGGLILDQKF